MRLATSSAPEQIVHLAAQFVRAWGHNELRCLPPDCQPPVMNTPQDVSTHAFVLAQAQLEFQGPLAASILLDRMALFFTSASSRLAHLTHIRRARI